MQRARFSTRVTRALAILLLGGGLFGAAQAYDFFFAAELERTIADQIDREVMVVDKLVKVWSYQKVSGYLRFDTERFRCAIKTTEAESIAILREVEERRKKGDRTLPLVALFGKVTREPLFGEVAGGESDGVVSEQILLIAEKIEYPRGRFFDEGN